MAPVVLGLGSALSEQSISVRTENIRWGYDTGSSYNDTGTTFVYAPHATRGTYGSWRFPLDIPQGATITEATFSLFGHDNGTDWNNLGSDIPLGFVQADDAAQVTNGGQAMTNLGNLGTTVVWLPEGSGGIGTPGTGGVITSGANLAPALQEIVDRGGWQSGNHVVMMSFTQGSEGGSVGTSGVGSPAERLPLLEVTFLA